MCNERAKVYSTGNLPARIALRGRDKSKHKSNVRYPLLPQNAAADILTALIIRLSSFPQKAPLAEQLIRF